VKYLLLLTLDSYLIYLISNFPPSAAKLFRLLPDRSGTYYQTVVSASTLRSFQHQLKTLFQRSFIY